MNGKTGLKIISDNRRARHDYHVHESLEAGIVLTGTEIKSLRAGKVNLKDSYAAFDNNELWLFNLHISPYEKGNIFNHDPLRRRKLLLHRRELNRLYAKTREKGYTLIPLKIYLKNGRAKIELGLASGKKLYDKRQDIAQRDARREMERSLGRHG
ncbi:MAG: SsrA-binding protein SmpB [Negativicutes bacterium]|nr:SsrA-binding protein SmpB [Negativicutes bacterium]